MYKILLFLLTLTPFQSFGQFDYELFLQYSDKKTVEQNIGVIRITEIKLEDNGSWDTTTKEQFNQQGLPVIIASFEHAGGKEERKEFIYDKKGRINKIETYEPDNYSVIYNTDASGGEHNDTIRKRPHTATFEFENNSSGQIVSYSSYLYPDAAGKHLMSKTYIEYNNNQTIKSRITVEKTLNKTDTTEMKFYDSLGLPTKSLLNRGFMKEKVEYIYNDQKTEVKEINYWNDNTNPVTILHKYKARKEIEKIDPSLGQPIYWKYDNNGRVTETNEAFFFVAYFTYDDKGRVMTKTLNVIYSDSGHDKLPKKIYYKYEYQFRN